MREMQSTIFQEVKTIAVWNLFLLLMPIEILASIFLASSASAGSAGLEDISPMQAVQPDL